MLTPAQKDVAALLLDSAVDFEGHDPQAGITRNQAAADLCRELAAALAASAPALSTLTDEQLLALNEGERFFSESPTKYPEAGHGTQYHAGAPGVVGFARAVLAASAPALQARRFSCHLERDFGKAPCDQDCGKLRCMYPSAPQAGQGEPSATMIDVAKRNLRSFLSKASFASNVDREAALNCVDVLVQAHERAASLQPAGTEEAVTLLCQYTQHHFNRQQGEAIIRAALSPTHERAAPAPEPVLPYDVTVGGGTFRKGVKLSTFVLAAQGWHRAANPKFYTLTGEEKAENLRLLQDCASPSQPVAAEGAPRSCRMKDGRCGICGGDWSVCGCEGMLRKGAGGADQG